MCSAAGLAAHSGLAQQVAPLVMATLVGLLVLAPRAAQSAISYHNGFQVQQHVAHPTSPTLVNPPQAAAGNASLAAPNPLGPALAMGQSAPARQDPGCPNGLLTFELSTGFIYKPSAADTLAMMPSTLQLTDCLEFCLQNVSCLAINFEMGLCVLLSSSAKQSPSNLFSSQFPVFTIYAEKKCLLQGTGGPQAAKQRLKCQRAWTFERVAGHEMKSRPRKRIKLATREQCMEACLLERDFECRSANWYRQSLECTLSDQDRHSASQSEAGDQQVNANQLLQIYGPSNLTASTPLTTVAPPASSPSYISLYDNYYASLDRLRGPSFDAASSKSLAPEQLAGDQARPLEASARSFRPPPSHANEVLDYPALHYANAPSSAPVDYLENNCIYEPNKLCEFKKIQNKVLKTVDSIYQDVGSLEECKQKCLSAPYRCYSFDYGDTSERVCRTSHLDQASLLAVKEPYLEVMGAITYELAACFSVTIQCRAKEMVALVSSSKTFRGRIYAKSRPTSCVNDVKEALHFELAMRYHDQACDVRASSNQQRGVFSNDIVIQHHDRIVTTQDVGLSLYCQYDLGNRSITNNVDLAIERLDEGMESKSQGATGGTGDSSSPLAITSLATTVVRSPNVTMRITNMNGQPVASATVGDRLALLFEIKEKTTPFGIFVREIIALDGKQLLATTADNASKRGYHYNPLLNGSEPELNENTVESMFQANWANSVQFIDSDGCPTDANIMGPLIRLDPAGHRILAPFDAFKFPASDMVFFRAVVTSCVSECRPPICGPQDASAGGGGGGGGIAPPLYSSTTMLASTTPSLQYSTTGASASDSTRAPPTSSTLGLAPDQQLSSQQWPTSTEPSLEQRNTSSYGALSDWSLSASSPSSMAANYELSSVTRTFADSLTTMPSFGKREPSPVPSNNRVALASAAAAAAALNRATDAPPAHAISSSLPMGATSTLATTSAATPGLSNSAQLSTLKLDPVQRQQILRLIEGKLRQQLAAGGNTSFPDMANLFASLLTSVMLDGVGGDSLAARRQAGATDEGLSPRSILDALGMSAEDASRLMEFARANLLAPPPAHHHQHHHHHHLHQPPPSPQHSTVAARRKRSPAPELQVSPARPVHLRQAQGARVAPSVARGARFTGSLVELYHHPAGEPLRRPRREAQPEYDMDELVVQSIKIVDRLHFSDEQVAQSGQRARGHRSLNRSQLVTADGSAQGRDPSSLGSISLLLVAVALGFIQVFLVLLCLLEFNQRRRLGAAAKRRRQLQTASLLNGCPAMEPSTAPAAALATPHHLKISLGTSHQLAYGRHGAFPVHSAHCAGCGLCAGS